MNKEKIVAELNNLVDEKKIPGYVIGLINKDEVFKYCYGYRQTVDHYEKTSFDTLYDIASLSKCISTASCILKLQQDDLLNINDKVSKYLDVKEKNITIKDCLTHSTGFESDIAGYKQMDDEQFLNAILRMESKKEYRGKVNYSDINFIYLGFIIDKITGCLANYSQEAIFKPLNMTHTGYNPVNKDLCCATEVTEDRGIIKGTVHDGKGYRLNGVAGSAGIFSNIDDLLLYVKALLNESFFSKESMQLIKNPLLVSSTGNRSTGWIISDKTNPSMGNCFSDHTIFHTGFTGGSIYVDFDNQLACIILCNRIHPSRNNDSIVKLRGEIHNLLYQ